MSRPNIVRRTSRRWLMGLRRTLSGDKTHKDDGSSISGKSERRSSFSTTSLFTAKTVEDEEHTILEDAIPEDPEPETDLYCQWQSQLFRRLPFEIRAQIYTEVWVASGVERHALIHNRRLTYSPCITDHEAPDDRQIGVAKDWDWSKDSDVQSHPIWFKRMTSKWCNHWKCERLWEDIRDGREVDFHRTHSYLSLLLSCKRIYDESKDSFQQHKTLIITDGLTLHRVLKWPRPRHFMEATYIKLALREESGNFLYLNGASLWHILAESDLKVEGIHLWLDAECPVTRRLLTEFRELYNCVPDSLTQKLTISFPCEADDGFWAWGEVEAQQSNGTVELLDPMEVNFIAVARGRQRFNETTGGYISKEPRGKPKRRVLRASNPFEDILLYGRGFYDDSYY
ncbi:hypothetical protein CCHL11_04520 [Colletotrichum chlorophyti]|uniref:DUF7730 domain-containing protein n=1 Tax=Colletotrichum chlorophyti TaxID=708187 RepID=A0A1Q8RRI7_9PEZI|nr:hypothetical protein CCHL11_04520 [Colletotrichum chlorophyti]